VHPDYRERAEVRCAAACLKERFFTPDRYNDRKSAAYWTKFQYPHWWTDILMALESLAAVGFTAEDVDVQRALVWFEENQDRDGLWPTQYGKGPRAAGMRPWVGLAICRVLRSFWG
jgi:hypothetical protein